MLDPSHNFNFKGLYFVPLNFCNPFEYESLRTMITSLDNVANSLASRSSGVEWSGIRDIFAMAKHIDGVVSLGIGQSDFDTPEHIRDAAKAALDDGYTRYHPAAGFEDLRAACPFRSL